MTLEQFKKEEDGTEEVDINTTETNPENKSGAGSAELETQGNEELGRDLSSPKFGVDRKDQEV